MAACARALLAVCADGMTIPPTKRGEKQDHFVIILVSESLFPFHTIITTSPKSAVARCSQSVMPETCIKFGEQGARVMIEEKEVPHFAIDVNTEKKEVSCWIASEEGKVRESFCY